MEIKINKEIRTYADVVTIDADRIARLKNVFWDMCAVTPHVKTTHHPDSDPDDEVDDSWTEKNLVITGKEGFISVARPDIFTEEVINGAT